MKKKVSFLNEISIIPITVTLREKEIANAQLVFRAPTPTRPFGSTLIRSFAPKQAHADASQLLHEAIISRLRQELTRRGVRVDSH